MGLSKVNVDEFLNKCFVVHIAILKMCSRPQIFIISFMFEVLDDLSYQ